MCRAVEGSSDQCLTLVRPGSGPMHGNISLCASSSTASASVATFSYDSADNVFDNFAEGSYGMVWHGMVVVVVVKSTFM